ncbi:MAG TPA: hypothetical protein VFP40_13325 [Terriglobales bacterium]|jgi:hypothetical protein|nr:hypothetical protein [Terriglobales bacterium]
MSVKTMTSEATSSNNEDRRETGLSLIVIGAMLWCFDAFVFFFLPAGIKLGQQKGFTILTGTAFLMGAVVMAIGLYLRKK